MGPPEFAFEWESPEEAMRFWTADLMHWPNGFSNLSATMDMPAFARGLNTAAEALCMPFQSMDFKYIRGYVYSSMVPFSTDPAEMGQRMQAMQGRMMEHVPALLERWRTAYEPEVRSINDDTLKGDYRQLGDRDLSQLLDMLITKREREGELHFLSVFPAMGAAVMFEQVYTQLLGAPKAGEHFQLLQGFPNKSVEVGDGLWRLAIEARKRPAVLAILQGTAPSATHGALAECAEGKSFHDAVEEFLNVYGWRGNELDVAAPTWKEDPTTVYRLIRDYAAREDYDSEDEFRSLVAARQAREKLAFDEIGDGEALGMFRAVLAGAQQYLPVQEDHNFWIDQQGVAVQRVPVLEAGRRLADAGQIDDANDIFLLEFDKVQEALRGGKSRLQSVVDQRRREQAENGKLTPPPAVGTPIPPEWRRTRCSRSSSEHRRRQTPIRA